MNVNYDANSRRGQNALGAFQNTASVGYLGPVITALANERRWAIPQSEDNSIVIKQSYPLQLLQITPDDLLVALRINAQGSSEKVYQQSLMPSDGTNLTLDLGAVRSFGVRVRITDSPLAFKFGAYLIQLYDGTALRGEIALLATKVPADVIILGISNNGGQASAQTLANPKVVVLGSVNGSATTDTTNVWAESLNLRDLGHIA